MPIASFLAEFPSRPDDRLVGLLKDEANAAIDEADRRLSLSGAPRGLRSARDRAARAVMGPDTLHVEFEMRGRFAELAAVALDGLKQLEAELARDAIVTFKRAPSDVAQKKTSAP